MNKLPDEFFLNIEKNFKIENEKRRHKATANYHGFIFGNLIYEGDDSAWLYEGEIKNNIELLPIFKNTRLLEIERIYKLIKKLSKKDEE